MKVPFTFYKIWMGMDNEGIVYPRTAAQSRVYCFILCRSLSPSPKPVRFRLIPAARGDVFREKKRKQVKGRIGWDRKNA